VGNVGDARKTRECQAKRTGTLDEKKVRRAAWVRCTGGTERGFLRVETSGRVLNARERGNCLICQSAVHACWSASNRLRRR
jgi:hypothetical protein